MRQLTITFTEAEARALWRAADCSIGDTTDDQDQLAVLTHAQSVKAGQRALRKVSAALKMHARRPERRRQSEHDDSGT